MGNFNSSDVAPWIQSRLLKMLNKVQSSYELASLVIDDPTFGKGDFGLGQTVAQRILDLRESLPHKQFHGMDELKEVEGLGEDKFRDLLYSVTFTADSSFRTAMYNGVIYENWHLDYYSEEIKDHQKFMEYSTHPGLLAEWAANKVEQVAIQRGHSLTAARLGKELVKRSYIECLGDAHLDSFSFALWMYRVDMDNWFSFQRVQVEAEKYFNFHGLGHANDIKLYMFKGFPNRHVLVDGISADDLPVVVNNAEQKLTIWTSELFD